MADRPGQAGQAGRRLLERKEFSEIWAIKWAELLMVKSTQPGQLQVDVPVLQLADRPDSPATCRSNKMVQDLLGASGGTFTNPATNYYQIERDTLKTAENVAQVFMGMRTQCAQCHNHPFDRWTMDDYYGFAAFFAQIGRKQGEDYRETIVFNSGGGEVNHPVGGRVMTPKFLGGAEPDVNGKDRREVLAKWLASPENPYFATSVANRVWAHFFGVGIVEPVDDIRVSNPASNPELFEALGDKLTELQLRLQAPGPRHLQLADLSAGQPGQRKQRRRHEELRARRHPPHPGRKPARLHQPGDRRPDKFPACRSGARAVQIADGKASNYFLTTFGRSPRTTVCAGEAKPSRPSRRHSTCSTATPSRARSARANNCKRCWMPAKTPTEVVEHIYIFCLCSQTQCRGDAEA